MSIYLSGSKKCSKCGFEYPWNHVILEGAECITWIDRPGKSTINMNSVKLWQTEKLYSVTTKCPECGCTDCALVDKQSGQ